MFILKIKSNTIDINIKFYYKNAQKREDLTRTAIEKGYLELCRKYHLPCNGSDPDFENRIDAMRDELINASATYEEILNATSWKHDDVFEQVICI